MKNTASICAKAVKKELKEKFPGIKFSVTSESFSGGDAVRVSWEDGPTYNTVNPLLTKYQYGHFDSMQDLYEFSNMRNDIPQTKYLSCSRYISEKTRANILPSTEKIWNAFPANLQDYFYSKDVFIRRVFSHVSIKTGEVGGELIKTNNPFGLVEDCYTIKTIKV